MLVAICNWKPAVFLWICQNTSTS